MVIIHEFIENIRAQNQGFGNAYMYISVSIQFRMAFEHDIQKSQASAFASQGAFTDAGKIGILVEASFLKFCHDALIFYPAIENNGVKKHFPHRSSVFIILDKNTFHKAGDREHSPGEQPAGCVIAFKMIT